ncbi:retrotransposon protein [Cucumis melo var. makuwa]|nr:retrotransposon protein [Cucumis melo var. makuwa]
MMEGTENEVMGLKEMMLKMKKSMDRLVEEMRENHSYRKREESSTSDGSVMKLKGKMEEFDETEKVNVTVVSFGQDDIDWYRWSHNRKKIESWEDLKSRMFEFFKDSGQKSLGTRLIRIQQDGSYNDYVKKIMNYSTPLSHMAESVLRDAFVTSLELALQAEVISRHPQTLEQCMKEAQLVNDCNLTLKLAREELGLLEHKSGEGTRSKSNGGNDKEAHKKTEFQMKQVTIPIKGSYQKNEPPIKRLSDAEFCARLDKGLYFRCNEKYSHGHRCKVKEKRELMLFILNEEEDPPEENREELVRLKQLELAEGAKIELKIIMSLSSKGTMKFKGVLIVVVLINSGAIHNFIHKKIVEERKLPKEVTPFGVTIGNGTWRQGQGICKRGKLKLNELCIVAGFLVVELGIMDLVLDMQWLNSTGIMRVHWPSLTMTFWVGERQMVLKGDPTVIKAECSLKTLGKTWEEEVQGFLVKMQFYEVETEEDYDEEIQIKGDKEDLPMIKALLERYSDIIEMPRELPPKRSINHHILTLPEQKPINVRPYKYSMLRKKR